MGLYIVGTFILKKIRLYPRFYIPLALKTKHECYPGPEAE